MTLNAQMNGLMNETLNVSGALLVKLFGREPDETDRFAERAARRSRDVGIRQALIGRWFFLGIGLVSAIGTALVFWLGGYLVLTGEPDDRDGRRVRRLPDPAVRPARGADERPGRARDLAGQLRARLRGAGPAARDRGAAGRGRA